MPAPRTIQTPGEAPAAPVKAAAPVSAPTADMDFGDMDDDAPQAAAPSAPAAVPAAFTPEQMAVVQSLISEAVRASKSSQDPATAAKLAAARIGNQKLPTIEAAQQVCADAVANGLRPRAILTDQGWYCHPEMGRAKAAGVATLGAEV